MVRLYNWLVLDNCRSNIYTDQNALPTIYHVWEKCLCVVYVIYLGLELLFICHSQNSTFSHAEFSRFNSLTVYACSHWSWKEITAYIFKITLVYYRREIKCFYQYSSLTHQDTTTETKFFRNID